MLGALLLIIVVIAAVASLSVFLSQTEKNAEERSALLTSVQNENLQIVYAQFSPSNSAIQWEFDFVSGTPTTPPVDYYVAVDSSATVTLTQIFMHGYPLESPIAATFASGNSFGIHKGVSAGLSAGGVITLGTCGADPYCGVFNPARWDNVTISVRNLNTEESGLSQIQVNDNWLSNWQEVTQTGQALSPTVSGSPNGLAIVLPARGTLSFNLSLLAQATPIVITKNESMKITLLTSAGNYFSGDYAPPAAVLASSTQAENDQVVTRDVITLDASQSFSSDSSIQDYVWQFAIPTASAGCTDSAFSSSANVDVSYASGETVQYLPESLFSGDLGDCITGPIRATLTVTDANGFSATSQPLVISPDPNIAPAASISANPTSCTGTGTAPYTCTVTITVDNIFGYAVNGAVVTAITTSGDAEATTPAGTTDSMGTPGQVQFTVNWTNGGTVEFVTGDLPPTSVSFSPPS